MLAYHGDVNLMKGAIYAADYVTTVSPTYADELQYPFYAHGLEGVIADNRHKLRGILNGIDTALYDPCCRTRASPPVLLPGRSGGQGDLQSRPAADVRSAGGARTPPSSPVSPVWCKHKGFDLVSRRHPRHHGHGCADGGPGHRRLEL